MNHKLIFATATFALLGLSAPCQAQKPGEGVPDLTKGGELTRINERWAGPIGVHFGYWRPRQGSNEQKWVRQLLVQKIEEGSPADGVLEVGDVILGADEDAKQAPLFQGANSPLVSLANTITEAEANNPAVVKLLVWRKGKTSTIPIQLEYLGRYSETAPYNCPKSKTLLRKGIAVLAKQEQGDKAGLGILCLLASDDATNPDNDKNQALAKKWVHELEVGGGPWHSGPKLMALAEYYMKTKDESLFPKLVEQAEMHAKGVSWFGTTGHRYCEPHPDGSGNGMIGGYGPISCSGTLGFLGLSLAREAGVQSEAVEKSHKAQRTFFGHYAFKGGLPYGEHAYGVADGLGDYNGKCGMSALAFALEEGEEKKTKFFARKSALSSDSVRGYAHGGPFFGQVFHPLGANLIGPKSANLQFREIRWHLDLKRSWDHTRIFDARSNPYEDFSYAATALLFYATPLKQLIITGRDRNPAVELSDTEFRELVLTKEFDPSLGTNEQLLAAIPSSQGFLRSSIADELSRRIKEKPEDPESAALIDQLLNTALNEDAPILARVGSCAVIMNTKSRSAEPVRSLKNAEIAKAMVSLLQHDTAYIRFAAVRVLQKLDPSTVRAHVNAIMDAIVAIERPTFPLNEEDPLQWAHGIMGQLLVEHVLKDNLDGIDRSKLIPAIRSMLQTPSGKARTASTKILGMLSKEETLAVSDLLLDNIQTPPPADSMFGRGAGPASQNALALYKFKELLPMSFEHLPDEVIKSKLPLKYGKAGLEAESPREFMRTMGEFLLVRGADIKELMAAVEAEGEVEELPVLKRIDSVKAADSDLKLPAAQTQLEVDATNFGIRDKDATTYIWRKLYGPGKVSFAPNASGTSKATTVTLVDKKPGNYRFEVEMSDSLGLSVVRETVTVTLYDSSGKLPSNKPPQAKMQSLQAVAGQALAVKLLGTDPDGDDLGYVLSQLPKHGKLTDANGRLVEAMSAFDGPLNYTADYGGHQGKDQLTFLAMDGQGKTAKGTVGFSISSKDVGVAVYDGFNYAEGPIHGLEGKGSFGFAGPWEVLKADERYKTDRGPLEGSEAGASISYPDLPHAGGRLVGQKHRDVIRPLDRKVMDTHKLLDPGSELWFSLFMEKPEVTLEFMGPQIKFGFATEVNRQKLHLTLNGQKTGESRSPWGSKEQPRFGSSVPDMLIGRCVWGKTDKDPDVVELYRVYDSPLFGPMLVEKPVTMFEHVIDQQSIERVRILLGDEGGCDELRIGPTLNSVMIGTVPLK